MKKMSQILTIIGVAAVLTLAACEQKGPAEKIGEKIDNATEQAGEAMENAKAKMKDAADKVEDQASEAMDEIKN
jgi:hyperosmotically inducible protein